MADGPCGEEFKAAFSCFVYSEDEPKGVDCVEKFRGMQECFRKYPEIYGSGEYSHMGVLADLSLTVPRFPDGDEYEEDVDELVAQAEEALAIPDHHFFPSESSK